MHDNASANIREFHGDGYLAALLEALEGQDCKPLVIECDGRTISAGYHVTEVKAGTFVALDCGGNPDSWNETILGFRRQACHE